MAVERTPSGSSLIDVLDRVLDKGIVIDAWVRVSLVGIDLVTVEARIVVASIDTYLKYSEAVGITSPISRPVSSVLATASSTHEGRECRSAPAARREKCLSTQGWHSMAVGGDRALAGLLSALAEAPDFAAAASFLLTQLAEIAGAPRAAMLRVDASQETLAVVASVGFDVGRATSSIPLSDLSSPIVISALALAPIRGETPLIQRMFAPLTSWITLPLSQPRYRGAPPQWRHSAPRS